MFGKEYGFYFMELLANSWSIAVSANTADRAVRSLSYWSLMGEIDNTHTHTQ